MFRTLALAGAVLLVLPAAALAGHPPPGSALVGHDAAGNAVAVWTASDGTLQTARQQVGEPWSQAVTLYTPSRLCKYRDRPRGGQRCTQDSVAPQGLVVNAAGQGFFAVVQTITNFHAHCQAIVAGRVSTHRTGGGIGALSVTYGECNHTVRNQGSIRDVQTAIAADGTAALGYEHFRTWIRGDSVALGTYPRGETSAAVTDVVGQAHAADPGLQVGIDDLDRATMVWRGARTTLIWSVDIVGAGIVQEQVSPRRGVGYPSLVVAADGTQTVTYAGHVLVKQRWVAGTVSQTRAAAGQPWSDPVLVP
jgi:hypothetical protein